MTPEQWKQVKLLFAEIEKLPPKERVAYIETHCSDEQVRKEVASLLFYHDKGDNFLPEQGLAVSTTTKKTANKKFIENLLVTKLKHNERQEVKDFPGTARFVIQKRLGAGGFGIVYQAYDCERDSIVALKTLRQAEAVELYLFKKEFRSLADLSHTNLVTLYELFCEQEQWFFTMEMVNGQNFLHYVRGKEEFNSYSQASSQLMRMDLSNPSNFINELPSSIEASNTTEELALKPIIDTCQIDFSRLSTALKQLVLGLTALHQAGKLHRDIKPSNVLVTPERRVVILDFGLISDLWGQEVSKFPNRSYSSKLSNGNLAGTPAFMSPEQAKGLSLSPASDWYGVGVMLYQAITGKVPFDGMPLQILQKKQFQEPIPPAQICSSVPENFNNLCQALLRREPTQRPSSREILQFLDDFGSLEITSTKVREETANTLPTFVGREKELNDLRQAWQLTKQGKQVILFVNGFSGIGKSALLHYFLETLKNESNLLILSGRCYEQESVPYKAMDSLIDLLSKYLKNLSRQELETILPSDVATLAQLFPVLRQVESIAKGQPDLINSIDSQELRRKAFVALRQLLTRLAQKKDLILFIDDLQWGDLDSAILLGEILYAEDSPNLLFIGSYRSEETKNSSFLQSFFNAKTTIKNPILYEIHLENLSQEESKQLARSLLSELNSAKRAEIIAQESEGSPFFISQLANYALANNNLQDAPTQMTIDGVIQARISQLSEEGRRFLELIAVSGQPLSRMLAKKATQLASDEQVLQVLRVGHLLRSNRINSYEEIDTYHDRIREAVLKSLTEESLKKHHSHLAVVLEEAQTDDSERLAKHFQLAGETSKAFHYTVIAADKAAELLAFDRAAHLYKESLTLSSEGSDKRTSLKIKLGKSLANAGKGVEAGYAYLEASKDTHHINYREILNLQHKAAEQLLNAGQIDEGMNLLKVVLKKHGMKLPVKAWQSFLLFLFGRFYIHLRGIKFQLQPESQISIEALTKVDVYWTVVDSMSSFETIRVAEFQNRHLLAALNTGEPYRLARALGFEATILSIWGKSTQTRVEKYLHIVSSLAEQDKNPELFAMVALIKSVAAYFLGNWQITWEYFCLGEQITRQECLKENYDFALRGLDQSAFYALRALVLLGDIKMLLQKIPPLLREAETRGNLLMLTNLRIRAFYLHLVADKGEKALQELDRVGELWPKTGFYLQNHALIFALCETYLYMGKGQEAFEKISHEWPKLQRLLVFGCQLYRVEAFHLYARTAIMAALEVTKPDSYLALAQRMAKKMLKEKTDYAKAWAYLIFAAIATCKKNLEAAISYLSLAEKIFEDTNMNLYRVATRQRRGELIGGDEGNSLIASCNSWMYDQQIKNPQRLSNMFIPLASV